ncbi:filamentous hemagglutinin N-terminal domain-containing protein [Leptolyngbya sp. CCNP1308]|uniref:two-partner secretion domain-containing protein n=1 Tax=Leptolyngbya sp. CCNP1308 TaxID=3110255 RepID=UPI002B1F5165|nr:filamentous hemagglutinin N-terminal domain-containing protein [Leptolyngbya sp. CCNP1308]MEA5449377.1 filamentous hemagglutinin N-terminal domain-containing protein [Leptolyngbya sp. CCNP1308]
MTAHTALSLVTKPFYRKGVLLTTLLATAGFSPSALAQIIPDATLGNEPSTVMPGGLARGDVAELIGGGAIRGGNLFHSFLEFNVGLGQQVYFANPAGIESILSRITGGNPSNIFGTLGVNGAADLFLINPNGIIFGENAALDIEGSFYASTAEAIPLGDGVYSATAPEQSSLLTVNPSALFSTYLSDASGDIENRGQLAAQGNMILAANNLDLQGQVAAGGELTLLGNTVQIRDAVDTPFVGFAGGDLLVQGNEQIDIVALNHADSGLYSYGDMVLRSANPMGGDAHYWSGGHFQVETMDGKAGNLSSPIDPIIRAFGSVTIGAYEGSSLHILAGGSVNIGTALINAPDSGVIGVDFVQETIELPDGTIVEVDGGAQPTLDVRAGVTQEALGMPPLVLLSGFNNNTVDEFFGNAFVTDALSSANITVGDVVINANNGLVLLTNQYEPNSELPGSILITGEGVFNRGIDVRGLAEFGGQGGAVYLDSRNNVIVSNSSIDTSGAGEVGDIVINAEDTARFEGFDRRTEVRTDLEVSSEGNGGNINITAKNLEIIGGAQISASTEGTGNAGTVVIRARNQILVDGISSDEQFSSAIFSLVSPRGSGNGGSIDISAPVLDVIRGGQISASTLGVGNAGSITIQARDVLFDSSDTNGLLGSAAFSIVNLGAIGMGGTVKITTDTLTVTNGAQLSASTLGIGDAGDVLINADDHVLFDNMGGALSIVGRSAIGSGGNVNITTNSLRITGGAQIQAQTLGSGNAGSVSIDAKAGVVLDGRSAGGEFGSGIFSLVDEDVKGQGGDIVISASSFSVTNGAFLEADTFGNGDAGSILIRTDDYVIFDGTSADGQFSSRASSEVAAGATGTGGNIEIFTETLEVTNGAQLLSSSRGNGDAGNVLLKIVGRTLIDNGTIATIAFDASGGDIGIKSGNLVLRNDGDIRADVLFGEGTGGNININADFVIALNDSDILAFSADGRGGNIDLSQTTFFGQNLNISSGTLSREDLLDLDGNNQVDVNATGGVVSGQIFINDSSFVENSLTNLEDTIVDTAALTAGSCIARTDDSLGSFALTGSGGLPQRPGDSSISTYPTGTVQTIVPSTTTQTLQEPDGIYQLPDGRLVLSRTCD